MLHRLLKPALGFVAATVAAVSAHSSPFVDAPVQKLMASAHQYNEPVTIIALFNNAQNVPFLSNSIRTYRDMRYTMMANATASQSQVSQFLTSTIAPIRFKTLWMMNAMILEIRPSDISKITRFNEIKALIANYNINIIPTYNRGYRDPLRTEGSFTYGLERLRVPELRQRIPQADGRGVTVGVLDTGIDANHPDLARKTLRFRDFISNKQAPYDDHGHGTHVSGTIAGSATSGTSIGVAPAAQLVVAKVFAGNGGSTLERLLQAMEWMADPDGKPETADHPALVSNSWGGGTTNSTMDPLKDVFCRSVDAWVKLGILPVFAAGNSGSRASTVNLPGACPSALAVGATDAFDKVAYFSSRGPAKWQSGNILKPNVSAPGVDVLSAAPGGKYQTMDGTSMATPHVAGLAALIAQARPGMSVNEFAQLIMNTADDLGTPGPDYDYGTGRVNAIRALAPFTPRQ